MAVTDDLKKIPEWVMTGSVDGGVVYSPFASSSTTTGNTPDKWWSGVTVTTGTWSTTTTFATDGTINPFDSTLDRWTKIISTSSPYTLPPREVIPKRRRLTLTQQRKLIMEVVCDQIVAGHFR